ncbi:MAG TPA: tyrosine--tRNA ligase [Candidatus Saccharimonadales bacterium]|nr:tyrosine--tRNA ligase [Candidatus Saccharimonadales bacterium]
MTLSEELKWRGLIKDKTFADVKWLDKPQAFYLGIDASADSLQVGNLAILMLVKHLAAAGWTAYLVMGGGTSLVGDPGGKNEERNLMSRETVKSNIEGVRGQVTKLLRGEKYTMVDNYDWLSRLKYVDFLREVGKHFSMTELMQRDFVVERMGKGGAGISYAEFSYSLVQGYDFWHLFQTHDIRMQIGGSDQWGNLISGVSLIRKKEAKEAHALSMPLIINKATGVKFGKSEGGAVWLDPNKTSPHDFYQFWINVDDSSVGDYLKIFTELGKDEVAKVMTAFEKDKPNRFAQKTLAYEVTRLVHGEETAEHEKSLAVKQVFGATHIASPGDSVIDLLLETGLAISKTGARQLLASGGIYINDKSTNKQHLEVTDFVEDELKLRRGKTLQNSRIIKKK